MDYTTNIFPYKIQLKFKKLFSELSSLENIFFKKKNIFKPTFVFGSPRSGTSLVTKIIFDTKEFGSILQKDMPFLSLPIFWSYFSKIYYLGSKKIKRFHNKSLNLSVDTADAFEEVYWPFCLENYENLFMKELDQYKINIGKLELSLKHFIKKILFLRKKSYYLSKNNLNFLRCKVIQKIFPDSRFVYCIRNPIDVVYSLKKLDDHFSNSKKKSNYLYFTGHYEFGLEKKTPEIDNFQQVEDFWNLGDNLSAYLLQWIQVNKFIYSKYLIEPEMKNNFIVICYDELINKKFDAFNFSKFLDIDKNKLEKVIENNVDFDLNLNKRRPILSTRQQNLINEAMIIYKSIK